MYCNASRYEAQHIRVFPLLARAASAANAMPVFRLWTFLRNAKPCGVEHFTRDEVIAVLASYGLSRSRWYALLEHPHFATFFHYDDKHRRLFRRGLEAVCADLDTGSGRSVWVAKKRCHRLQAFNAECYAASIGAEGRRVARSTLATETGRSASTQRRYEELTGVQTESNYVYASIDDTGDLPIPERQRDRRNDGYVTQLDDGESVIVWQTVNTYRNEQRDLAPVGMSRRVARKLRSGVDLGDVERRERYFVERLRGSHRRTIAVLAGRVQGIDGVLWRHLAAV